MADDGWALLGEYASLMEASLDLGTLETEGVPTLVRGNEPGVLGFGFTGGFPHGIRVYVPAEVIDDARFLIGVDPTPDPL